jgi:hypothetical protein
MFLAYPQTLVEPLSPNPGVPHILKTKPWWSHYPQTTRAEPCPCLFERLRISPIHTVRSVAKAGVGF